MEFHLFNLMPWPYLKAHFEQQPDPCDLQLGIRAPRLQFGNFPHELTVRNQVMRPQRRSGKSTS